MRSFDLILMGLKNLFRRKTRTILTVLGVIIGTAAIVVMISLGLGMNESFDQQVKQMGNLNIINVTRYKNSAEGMRISDPKEIVLDDKTVAQIRELEGVAAVTPILNSYGKLVSGKYMTFCSICGVDSKAMEKFDFKISEGRLLQEGDTDFIVIGGNIPQNFYNPKNPYRSMSQTSPVKIMTDKMQITFDMNYGEKQQQGLGGDDTNKKPAKLYKVKAAGLLVPSNGNGNDNKDYSIYMDINNLKKLIKDTVRSQQGQGQNQGNFGIPSTTDNGYESLMVMVEDLDNVDSIQKQIDDMGYGTNSLGDTRKAMQKQSQTLQIVLGGLGALSLLISALGITNTMIMSIYERTREIGVMKVLGCRMNNIKQLFLFEAGVIGLFGGIVGIILSYIASFILNTVGVNILGSGGQGQNMSMGMRMGMRMGMEESSSKISVIPLWLALFAIAFAILIGLVSGFSPAKRAMKLSALEAIKSE
ncbi:MAG: ABC transporter permease [Ruminiclostridium sp.]